MTTTRRVIQFGAVLTSVAFAGGRLSARPPAETVHLEDHVPHRDSEG